MRGGISVWSGAGCHPVSPPFLSPQLADLLLREGVGSGRTKGETDLAAEEEPGQGHHFSLICRGCGHPITVPDARLSVGGSHLHTFFNPSGIVYEVGCFRVAPGCSLQGEASAEFSWFAGHLWRVALCGRCNTHLGWRFESADSRFFGLIVGRLLEHRVE